MRIGVRRAGDSIVIALVFLLFGCGDSAPSKGTAEIPGGACLEDLDPNRCFNVDESRIAAAIKDRRLDVEIPVTAHKLNSGSGSVRVTLTDLAGEVIGSASVDFEGVAESPDNEEGIVSLSVPDLPEAVVDGAGEDVVVRYDVSCNDGGARGARSLFYVVPHTQAVLRGPDQLMAGATNHIRVYIQEANHDTPMADVEGVFSLKWEEDGEERSIELYSGRTDQLGGLEAEMEIPDDLPETAELEAEINDGEKTKTLSTPVKVKRLQSLLLTTDKPLYQPGQVMHIRSLALRRPDLSPAAGAEAVIEVTDSKGNKVFKKNAANDDFGIASAEFKLAGEVLLGAYTVSATVGESREEKTVTVDRYALPKFNVGVATDKTFYRPGERLSGSLDVQYFFGQPVAGGEVTVTAKRFDVELSTFEIVSGRTDENGLFNFEIELPAHFVGQPLDDGNAFVLLQIDVTDTAGQNRVVELTRPVVSSAILPQVIPESGEVVPGADNVFYLLTTDPNGRPVSAESEVAIGDQELSVSAGDSGIGSFSFMPESDGVVEISVTSADDQGNQGSRVFSFEPGKEGAFVLLRTDRSVYRVGDTVTVSVICPDIENAAGAFTDRVYLDIIKDGRTVLMTTVELSNGDGTREITVAPDLTGGFEIEAYYLTLDSTIMRDRKLVYADPADQLSISVASDRDIFAPADEANLTFTVTDAEGSPVRSAIGLQVVDEAVFSLMEFRPGLEKVFYAMEEEILKPKYEIHGYEMEEVANDTLEGGADERDDVAELMFAAASGGSFGLTLDTFAGTLAQLKQIAKTSVDLHVEEMGRRLQSLAKSKTLESPGAAVSHINANAACWRDPWQTPYRVSAIGNTGLSFTSAGPDEVFGTEDDTLKETYPYLGDVLTDGREVPAAGGDGNWDMDTAGAEDDFDLASGDADSDGDADGDAEGEGAGPRVRKDFPETLYVNPSLITDASGRADVAIPLADSITTWRVSALASSMTGLLGSAQSGITVFQDFFVDIDFPAQLTQDDEIAVPIAIYNYLDEAQTITLTAEAGDWFDFLNVSEKTVEVGPGEVIGESFAVRVNEVGAHAFTVYGVGDTLSDAVQRRVEVVPNGKEVLMSESGRLSGPVDYTAVIPAEAIDGASKVMVKIYPGMLSQAVEGLDSLLQVPSGCFEQTSSTTYPNVLVLNYMMSTGQITPEIELKAREYVNLGYQKLLTYEVDGGGFEWFGESPAHNILTAYGLLELSDMAKVHPVDPAIIERTQDWLAAQQSADGSFEPSYGGIAEGAINAYEDDVTRTTAYLTYALLESEYQGPETDAGVNWLKANASSVEDAYGLAMVANALVAYDPDDASAQEVLSRLHDARVEEGDTVYWIGEGESTTFGTGDVMTIETTALAAFAMLRAGVSSDDVTGAVNYLIGKKDSFGNWDTTQATILTLRLLLASLESSASPGAATVRVYAQGTLVETLDIDEATSDVLRLVDLGAVTVEGENAIRIEIEGDSAYLYQIVTRYYLPWTDPEGTPDQGPLDLDVSYDKTTLSVDDIVRATVTVSNNIEGTVAKMVLVDIGLPPGFELITDELKQAVESGILQKFEKTARQLTLYVEGIPAGDPLVLDYQLRALYPLTASSGESKTHPYYSPKEVTQTSPTEFVVSE